MMLIRSMSLIIATEVAVIFWQHNLPPEVTLILAGIILSAIIACLAFIKNNRR
jgi:UDP-N-acetylmuramyl pentapeptide phosphotransferase/UDP-N-acetylglucosamine-1-phosphate transferase